MTRLLIALLAAALLVAGCGGDDDDNADATDAATTAQTQPQTTPTDTGEETTPADEQPESERDEGENGGDSASRGNARELEQAVEACKENVAQAPQLSKDAKDDLVDLCEQAATGDPEDLREVSRKVCERIIEDTLPAGEQRDQALRLCERTGEQ